MCAGTHVPKGLATAINLRRRLRGDLKTSAPVAMHYAFLRWASMRHTYATQYVLCIAANELLHGANQISYRNHQFFPPATICHPGHLSARRWKKSREMNSLRIVDSIGRYIIKEDARIYIGTTFLFLTQSIYLEGKRVRNFNFIIVSTHPRDLLPECSEVINMGLKDASPPLPLLKGNSDLRADFADARTKYRTHSPDGTIQWAA